MLGEICNNLKSTQGFPIHLLRYLVGVLNYGGKLTQKEDQTILDAQIKTFINNRVFEDGTPNTTRYAKATSMLDETARRGAYDLTGY